MSLDQEFAAELSQEQLAALGCIRRPWQVRYQAPGETALRRALQRVEVEALDRLVGGWLAARLPAGDASAVAVDGKSFRGAIGADGRRVHLLATLVHGHGTVIAQRQVAAKTNEIGAFAPLLDDVDVSGRVVTADSLHTHLRPHLTRHPDVHLPARRPRPPTAIPPPTPSGARLGSTVDRDGCGGDVAPIPLLDSGAGLIPHAGLATAVWVWRWARNAVGVAPVNWWKSRIRWA